MKKILFVFMIFGAFFSQAQQYIVEFPYNSKEQLKDLSKFISIDKVYDGKVRAYIWGNDKLELFENKVSDFKFLPHPSKGKEIQMATTIEEMANWDRYPTYQVYVEMMQLFAQNYPELCILDTIGYSQNGRLLLALKISDNPQTDENEPEFFYTSTMHGDETTGFVLMLRFIDYLLKNYGVSEEVTNLINNIEIWINPLANPDGTYNGGDNTVANAQRYLANGVDPNRNFPDPQDGNHPDGEDYAPETIAMMNFASAHHFVMSANMHGGAEVYNYPWDTWGSGENPHTDANWFEQVGLNYIQLCRQTNPNYATDVTSSGVTEGYDWYEVQGGRQDFMNYFKHCREVTLELSTVKLLSSDELPTYWDILYPAFLYYMEQSLYGFRGVMMNENCNPLSGMITVQSHDDVNDSSFVFSDPNAGDYHRPIYQGNYNIICSVNGFSDLTAQVQVHTDSATIKDFFFNSRPNTNITLTISDKDGNPLDNVSVNVLYDGGNQIVTTDDNGQITLENMPCGTYKFTLSKSGYLNLYYWETITPQNNDLSFKLYKTVEIYGYVINALTGEPLPDATVRVPGIKNSSTNNNGFYQMTGLSEGTEYQVIARAEGFETKTVSFTPSSNNEQNRLDFALLPANPISFEDSIPEGFTFDGNADWFRTNAEAYSGDYSMRSGDINDDQSSVMEYTTTTTSGEISFYIKVSSENGYDFLSFSIDGNEQDNWSGEMDWTEVSFDISEGTHTFTWSYEKDGSVSEGEDCAWVDYIILPTTTQYPQSNVTFLVKLNGEPLENAKVELTGYGVLNTNAQGNALFENVYNTTAELDYKVSYEGYDDITGSTAVNSDTTIIVEFSGNPSDVCLNKKMILYPNPANNLLIIKSLSSIEKFEIYTTEGKKVKSGFASANNIYINVSDLTSGIYFIKIYTNEKISALKFVKE